MKSLENISLLFIFLFILSCNTNIANENQESKNSAFHFPFIKSLENEGIHENKEMLDSTRNKKRHYTTYDLRKDIDLKLVGKLILIDSILPVDDDITFRILDTMSMADKASRDYFFPVFKKIIEHSDGALSEIVGSYAIKYIIAHPKEFANRYSCCNKLKSCCEDLLVITDYVGSEFMLGENPEMDYLDFLKKIKSNYPNFENDKTLQSFKENLENYMQKWKD